MLLLYSSVAGAGAGRDAAQLWFVCSAEKPRTPLPHTKVLQGGRHSSLSRVLYAHTHIMPLLALMPETPGSARWASPDP